jgi:hypothetical protein
MQVAHCMSKPWVSLRCDQLNLFNKVVKKKEHLEKGLEEEEEKSYKSKSTVLQGHFI